MGEEKERILVHKHFQLFKDQADSLEKLKKEIGEENAAPILRKILDHFFSKTKENQTKIIKNIWWKK